LIFSNSIGLSSLSIYTYISLFVLYLGFSCWDNDDGVDM